MTAEDSHADDRVCLILQAAQDLESPNPDATCGGCGMHQTHEKRFLPTTESV